ncbi:transcription factor 7-like [Gouania willdenowi]|uniref:transcription factor 7-like n=1 Tax=Gouania willdenowi TaxID=441366 RepID=UPI001056385C|nr:transcription factor 7-like [Gouania willdenowi]
MLWIRGGLDCKSFHPWGSEEGLQEATNPPHPSISPDVQQQNSTDTLDDVLCVIEEMWAREKQEDEYRAQQNGGQYGGQQNPCLVAFNDGGYRAQTIEEHTNLITSLKQDYWPSPNLGPLTFPLTPSVAKYVNNLYPPANTSPATTYHETPVYAAGWTTAPTFGGQKTKKIQKEKEAEGLVIKNAFTLFIKEKRENVEKELGVITSTEVNKLLAERWNLLAPDQREKYIAEATVDAILYAMKNPGRSHKINYRNKRKQSRAKGVHAKKTK